MRTVRNITVCVSPELYRQTKQLAAKYDTTVTGVVAFLLEQLPDALARAAYPVGGTKRRPDPPVSASIARFEKSEVQRSFGVLATKAIQDAGLRSTTDNASTL